MKVALIIAAACLLTACGASSSHAGAKKQTYEREMASIVPPLQSKIFKLRFALEQVRSPIVARDQLHNLETRLDDGAVRLEALEVPGNVASEHTRLILGYRSLRSEFDRALRPMLTQRSTDAFRVRAAKLARAPGFQAVAGALQAIIAKGYDLGFPKSS